MDEEVAIQSIRKTQHDDDEFEIDSPKKEAPKVRHKCAVNYLIKILWGKKEKLNIFKGKCGTFWQHLYQNLYFQVDVPSDIPSITVDHGVIKTWILCISSNNYHYVIYKRHVASFTIFVDHEDRF